MPRTQRLHLVARLPPCCRAGQAEERVARLEQLAMQLASEQTVLQVWGGTCPHADRKGIVARAASPPSGAQYPIRPCLSCRHCAPTCMPATMSPTFPASLLSRDHLVLNPFLTCR